MEYGLSEAGEVLSRFFFGKESDWGYTCGGEFWYTDYNKYFSACVFLKNRRKRRENWAARGKRAAGESEDGLKPSFFFFSILG